jgi:CSLREA domain-containing protein
VAEIRRLFFDIDDGTNTLKDVTITGLTIRDGGDGSTFMNGAGIFSRENLTLDNVALLNNDAGPDGGGGGLEMFAGTLKMSNSTVAGNKSRQGGGIEIASETVAAVIVNSTISGNESRTVGGGLTVLSGNVVVRNCTITGNRSDSDGSGAEIGGGVLGIVGLLTLHNTIVAGNFRGTSTTADDVGNPLVAGSSHNLIGNHNTAGGLQHNVSGNLLGNNGTGTRPIATILNTTLASNGGPTQTHALVTGSVAINAGSSAHALDANGAALTRDQRGGQNPRILGTVDIGAFELISVSGPIVVDTTVDENDGALGTGDVSLREAIALANLIPGANSITFATATDGQPIDLANLGFMLITETLTITGNGAANTIIDGQQRGVGILRITTGDVTLNNLTLQNGTTNVGGGAILSTSTGTLTISQSTLSGNSSSSSGTGRGGAIYARSGAVTISQSTLSGNSSSSSSSYGSSDGGAISTGSGAVTISQSTLSGNSSSSSSSYGSYGGAIYTRSGAVTISQSTLSGNSSSSSDGHSRGGAISTNFGEVTINQSTLSGNSSSSSDSLGGAISTNFGAVTISQSTLSGNSSSSSDLNSRGGAIYAGSGVVTISQSTLSGNSSNSSMSSSRGGAVFAGNGVVMISQSTLSGNSSSTSSSSNRGGAICAYGNTTIRNSLVAGNTASYSPDLFLAGFGTVIVTNSLIGRGDGASLTPTLGTAPDANGNFIGGATDATKIDPKLGPLADNGGPTKTHALLAGSLAVNRGSNSHAVDITNGNVALTTDQRGVGFSRFQFTTVDMGAFESSDIDPIDGTAGNDVFVVVYPSTATTGFFTVTRSSNGGPVSNLGTFPMSFSLTLNGLEGTDTVFIAGTDSNDTFTVANDVVTTNGSILTLSSIENRTLAGGAGGDVYKFYADAALGAYTLDESGGDTDTIDFSLTTTVGIALQLGNAAMQTVHGTNLQLNLLSSTRFENAVGGAGADTLTGNSLNNILAGNAGNDTLNGSTGSDLLYGGLNDDNYVFSAAAPGEADHVSENANEGVDTLNFASVTSNLTLSLGLGTVQSVHVNRTLKLNHTTRFENVVGGAGADRLTGNSLNNTLRGNAGNDTLTGASGSDILNGGPNNDIYVFGAATTLEADQVNELGNEGTDTLDFFPLRAGVTLNLGSTAVQTVHANRKLKLNVANTFENAIGGAGADTLIGNSLNNTLTGNAGDDTLNGSTGSDLLFGGLNDDDYVFSAAAPGEADQVSENANEGMDTLDFSAMTATAPVKINLGLNTVQNIHANRTLKLNHTTRFENVVGGAGADRLTGNVLNNTLTGNAGNDTLNGAAGSDILNGGLNNDSYVFATATSGEADQVNELGNQGTDTLDFSALSAGVTLNLGSTAVQTVHANRTLKLNVANTFENAVGGNLHDLLIGNALNNRLEGGIGNNILIGNTGNDILLGGRGRDILIGGFGADVLNGGDNQDILIAGWRTVDGRMNSSDIANIRSVLAEWTSVNSYAVRVAHLRGGAGSLALISLVAGSDVRNDSEVDTLTGGLGGDWYFFRFANPNVNNDKVTDQDTVFGEAISLL